MLRPRSKTSFLLNVPFRVRHLHTHALFERLFACLPDGLVVVDGEGRILEANPKIESLFGYACSELLGSPIETLIPERFRSAHAGHRRIYNREPKLRAMGAGPELCGRRKDGTEFPLDIMLTPVTVGKEHLVLGVVRDVTERKQLERWMLELALTDPLTGLGNYRRLQEAFEREMKWSQRTSRPFALLLIDLDGLKQINDSHGHAVGTRALCRLGDVLRSECRSVDIAARHGGDEFAVILPDTGAEGARNLAWRLATRLANDGDAFPVSFSYGAAVYGFDGETIDQLLQAADEVLYTMKRAKH